MRKLSTLIGLVFVATLGVFSVDTQSSEPASRPEVWRTIKVGTGLKTMDDFRGALEGVECHVNGSALHVLESPAFTVSAQTAEVSLVRVSLSDLGLKRTATREEIYARAEARGLKLCPPEVALELRLQYLDQPDGEWLHVAMRPVLCRDGEKKFLAVARSVGALWLYGVYGAEASMWTSDDLWIFVLPK